MTDISPNGAATPPAPAPRKNRGWIWFFALLALLTVAGISLNWWFNLRQQLTPEQLAAARALWNAKGPHDYELEYTEQGSARGTYLVQVRGGKVVSATLDGRPLEPRLYPTSSMPALFDDIERFL